MNRVVGSVYILVKFYIIPSQNEDKSCSSHINKELLRELFLDIEVHARRWDGILLSRWTFAYVIIHDHLWRRKRELKRQCKVKRGDSRGTSNIQTVWHDKDVGVFHEPDKKVHGLEQPLQKLIPAAREMICCWERELRKGIKRMASTLWNSSMKSLLRNHQWSYTCFT